MKKNQQLSWNDYLFENRHKAYGAYVLRTGEGNNLLKSLLLVTFIVGVLVTVLSFTSKSSVEMNDGIIINCPVEINPIKIKDEIVNPEIPNIPKIIPAATVDKKDSDVIPDPRENPEVEKPLTQQNDIGKRVMPDMNGNAGGEGSIKSTGNTGISGTGDEGGTKQPETPEADDKIYMPRLVSKMAVFPGCENAGTTKKALQDCRAEKLSNELGIQLNDFGTIASRNNINQAQTKLNFIVDKSGKIVEVKAVSAGDQTFSKEAQDALKRISERLAKKGKYLKPAELDDGTKVNMSFTIPVQFQAQ